MSRRIDLPNDVMTRAAQYLFAADWASAREAAGFRFRPGTEISATCPALDAATLLRLVRPYVVRLARAWGLGIGEMFRLMEIPEGEWADALYLILMSCRGHGISLADDHDENIALAERKLEMEIDTSPFDDDFMEFYMLASEVVGADACKVDDDPNPNAPFQPGDRVNVDSRLPTGDRVIGVGTIVRWIAEADPLSAGEGAVVEMNDGEQIEPWSYQATAIFVPEGECEAIR